MTKKTKREVNEDKTKWPFCICFIRRQVFSCCCFAGYFLLLICVLARWTVRLLIPIFSISSPLLQLCWFVFYLILQNAPVVTPSLIGLDHFQGVRMLILVLIKQYICGCIFFLLSFQ